MKKNRFSHFNNKLEASTSKKTLAFVIDAFVNVILSVLLIGFTAFPILSNFKEFKDAQDEVGYSTQEIYKIQEETKFTRLDKNSEKAQFVSVDTLVREYFNKQVALSFEKHGSEYFAAGIPSLDAKDQTFEIATHDNDNLAYYFVHYKFTHNIKTDDYGILSSRTYFTTLLKGSEFKALYTYNEADYDDLPYITYENGIAIYNYLYKGAEDSTAYTSLFNCYVYFANKGLEELKSYDLFMNHYDNYRINLNTLFIYEAVFAFVTVAITYLVSVVLPQIIFGNGVTLGRFLTKTRVVYNKENYGFVALRMLIELHLYVPTLFLSTSFSIGAAILGATVNGFSLIYIVFACFTFLLIDFVLLTLTKNKKSIAELATKSYLVDLNTIKIESKESTDEELIDESSEQITEETTQG